MKYATAVAMVLCSFAFPQTPVEEHIAEGFISAAEPSTQAELDLYTLVSVETPEDLENLLENGYPTPEIEAILNDESIPEKDRYWLDCRMRSVTAQLLHRFYDRHGNIIEVDADWIRPGEDYWQEIMMVNPAGEPRETQSDGSHFNSHVKPGSLYNLYGERIGTLAAAVDFSRTSRDGSVTVVQSGRRWRGGGGGMYFCFLYPDGSFIEVPFPDQNILSDGNMAVSQDGSISAWNVFQRKDFSNSQLLILDSTGNEMERYTIPNMASRITISPNNRYVAVSLSRYGSCIIDRDTGEIMQFASGSVRQPFFSENSRFCALPDGGLGSSSNVIDLTSSTSYLLSNRKATLDGQRGFGNASLSNNGRIVLLGGQGYLDESSVFANPSFRYNSISPEGYFCFFGRRAGTYALGIRESFTILSLESLIQEAE